MSNVAVIDQAQPRLSSGGKVAAIVPQTMEDAYRLAKAVCMAGMAPKGMDTPEKCMISIMRGLEVGLTPFQALDKIAVVNGRPTIWGDGAMALVRGSGLCEFIRETIEGDGDTAKAVCRAKRKGESEPIVGEFSVADAKKAGLWGKQGPWQQFPKRMLQMRARAFALRDGFADVLGGLYLKEEMDNGPSPETDTNAGSTPPDQARRLSPPPAEQSAGKKAPPGPPPPPPTATTFTSGNTPGAFDFEGLRTALRAAPTEEAANDVFDRLVTQMSRHMTDDELSECDNIAREAYAAFVPAPED